MQQRIARLIQRHNSAAVWESNNPILLQGEIGFETDTSTFKVGDGIHTWNQLQYASQQNNPYQLYSIGGGLIYNPRTNELSAAINYDIIYARKDLWNIRGISDNIFSSYVQNKIALDKIITSIGNHIDSQSLLQSKTIFEYNIHNTAIFSAQIIFIRDKLANKIAHVLSLNSNIIFTILQDYQKILNIVLFSTKTILTILLDSYYIKDKNNFYSNVIISSFLEKILKNNVQITFNSIIKYIPSQEQRIQNQLTYIITDAQNQLRHRLNLIFQYFIKFNIKKDQAKVKSTFIYNSQVQTQIYLETLLCQINKIAFLNQVRGNVTSTCLKTNNITFIFGSVQVSILTIVSTAQQLSNIFKFYAIIPTELKSDKLLINSNLILKPQIILKINRIINQFYNSLIFKSQLKLMINSVIQNIYLNTEFYNHIKISTDSIQKKYINNTIIISLNSYFTITSLILNNKNINIINTQTKLITNNKDIVQISYEQIIFSKLKLLITNNDLNIKTSLLQFDSILLLNSVTNFNHFLFNISFIYDKNYLQVINSHLNIAETNNTLYMQGLLVDIKEPFVNIQSNKLSTRSQLQLASTISSSILLIQDLSIFALGVIKEGTINKSVISQLFSMQSTFKVLIYPWISGNDLLVIYQTYSYNQQNDILILN